MRFILTSGIALICSLLWLYDKPKRAEVFVQRVDSIVNAKEISILGLNNLSREQVEKFLLIERSTILWRLNPTEVERALKQNPFIEQAKLEPCSNWSYSCFRLEISEKKLRYLSEIDGVLWVLADNGDFVAPLSDARDLLKLSGFFAGQEPKILRGLSGKLSSDLLRARARFASDAINAVEKNVNSRAEQVEIKENGELIFKFSDYGFLAIFEGGNVGIAAIEKMALRLSSLLKELGHNVRGIERIDLAYDRIAVVKYKEFLD